jgi:membrane fusion protein, multidrug efflux system
MNSNLPLELNEDALSSANRRKKSPLAWIIWIVLIGIAVFAAYHYETSLMAMIRRPATVDAATVDPGPASGRGRGGRGAGPGPNGTVVTALPVRRADMPIYLRGLGTVTAYSNVTVKPRVDGQLIHVAFKEGQFVREGELLAEVDPRPFQVQLSQADAQRDQARGNLQRDTALLRGAQTEYDRNKILLDKGLIPKQQFDMQSASVDQYKGSIAADTAAIETAEAAIANANLQITYSKITAPISGRIGLRLVDPGNIVRAADPSGIALIAQLQPIAVLFNIPEDDLAAVLKKLRAGDTLKVEAWDRDDQTMLARGTLLTVDNQIDQSTGTSRLKAVFDNMDNALYPNQFVNVHLLLEIERNAAIIPMAAIQRGPQGTYVYVVGPDKKAQIRTVTLKNTQGNDVSVGMELQQGELVVVEGTDRIQDGSRVDVQADGDPTLPPTGAGRGQRGGRGQGGFRRQQS